MDILIISGLSGAGKSQVAGVLEDMDFYCVDNMPVSLIPKFGELCSAARGRYERVALVTDVRGRESFQELFRALDELVSQGHEYKILFVEAEMATIVKRYKETRRPHPIYSEREGLEFAVNREKKMLQPIRDRADYIIDTTDMTLGGLRRKLANLFEQSGAVNALEISVMSFGYKYGIPMEADVVFDVRFLPNPYYDPALREKSGLDASVADYVFSTEQAREFMYRFEEMMEFLLPNYEEEGKRTLTICIGCTGGRHRSVAVAAALADFLTETGNNAACIHRDINKV